MDSHALQNGGQALSGRRFLISSRSIHNGYATFDGELFNHMVRVLRLGTGAQLTLIDENEHIHQAVIDQVDREWVAVKIISSEQSQNIESAPPLTICQALPKGDKIDLILQKGTELGVHDFWIFGGRRSVARVREDHKNSKLERWNRIITEAARQCKRNSVPKILWFPTAAEAANASEHTLRLLLWEDEKKRALKKVMGNQEKPDSAIVAIGPEGGFDPAEVQHFADRNFTPVSMGNRILRTETAALAITAILQYIWEEI